MAVMMMRGSGVGGIRDEASAVAVGAVGVSSSSSGRQLRDAPEPLPVGPQGRSTAARPSLHGLGKGLLPGDEDVLR